MSALNTLQQYGSSFQIKVLSSLLKHKEFLNNIHDILNPDEFDSPSSQWIIKETIKYYQKYHNDSYAAINLNCSKITLSPSQKNKLFQYSHIKRSDLSEAEIVINISDAKHVEGNMKFSSSQKISIIADRIHDSYAIDLSKTNSIGSLLNKKWIMSIYNLEKSSKTNKNNQGFFRFIDNNNAKIDFDKSSKTCKINQIQTKN